MYTDDIVSVHVRTYRSAAAAAAASAASFAAAVASRSPFFVPMHSWCSMHPLEVTSLGSGQKKSLPDRSHVTLRAAAPSSLGI